MESTPTAACLWLLPMQRTGPTCGPASTSLNLLPCIEAVLSSGPDAVRFQCKGSLNKGEKGAVQCWLRHTGGTAMLHQPVLMLRQHQKCHAGEGHHHVTSATLEPVHCTAPCCAACSQLARVRQWAGRRPLTSTDPVSVPKTSAMEAAMRALTALSVLGASDITRRCTCSLPGLW